MTLKQGEDINKQFTALKDSIIKVEVTVEKTKADLDIALIKNKAISDELVATKAVVDVNMSRIKYLEEELVRTKKDLIQDKKFVRRQTTTLAGIISSFIVAMYFFVK